MSTSDWLVVVGSFGGLATVVIFVVYTLAWFVLYPKRRSKIAAEAQRFVDRVYKPAFLEVTRQERIYIESDGKNDRSRSRARGVFASVWKAYRRSKYYRSAAVRATVNEVHKTGKTEHGIRLVSLGGFVGWVFDRILGDVPDYSLCTVWGWTPPKEVQE